MNIDTIDNLLALGTALFVIGIGLLAGFLSYYARRQRRIYALQMAKNIGRCRVCGHQDFEPYEVRLLRPLLIRPPVGLRCRNCGHIEMFS